MNKKSFELENKNIILVGATGILGKTFAHALIEEGANLILLDHPDSDLMVFSERLKVLGIHIDLGDESSVINAIDAAQKELGNFDVVINNAAATTEYLKTKGDVFMPFENYPIDVWKHSLDIDLTGTFLVCRESGKFMSDKGGSIINISSIYGIVGPDHRIYEEQDFKSLPGYSASKAGVIGLTRWLATWWSKKNIRVNCITPGGVFNNHDENFVAEYANRTPMGRMAEREELIGIILFLASELSSYSTGQNYIIDGGYSAW